MGYVPSKIYQEFVGMIRNRRMRYETELYSVLLLIVVFLVLISLSSLRLSSHVRTIFENQVFADLEHSALVFAEYLKEQPKLRSSTSEFRNMVDASFADSVHFMGAVPEEFVARGSQFGRLTSEEIGILENGDAIEVSPDESQGYALLFPFRSTGGDWVVIRVFKKTARFGLVKKLSMFGTVFQFSALLAIILLGYLYVRVTLKPFIRMKDAARKAEEAVPSDGEISVESIVESFQGMIDELQSKEEVLQGLYQKTQKRAERLEQFNEYILLGMASGLISCDRDSVITHFNMAAQRLLRIEETDAIGLRYDTVLNGYADLADLIETTLSTGQNSSRIELDISSERKDLSLGVSTTLVRDERDRKVGVTVIMTDLTEVKNLQRDIAYKEKMAALGETAAGLAHELRNSMTAVHGFGKLLRTQASEKPELKKLADSISMEASATEQMLSRFLEFAQPTNFCIEDLALDEIVAESIQSLAPSAGRKGIRLEYRRSKDPVRVAADHLALRQILTNLLTNAIDASPENEVVVVATAHDGGEREVELSVSDRGPGIPREIRRKVFNPFFTTKEDGTGLGLCTVKKFVSGMAGKLDLREPEEEGTTVHVILPRSSSDSETTDANIRLAESSS